MASNLQKQSIFLCIDLAQSSASGKKKKKSEQEMYQHTKQWKYPMSINEGRGKDGEALPHFSSMTNEVSTTTICRC